MRTPSNTPAEVEFSRCLAVLGTASDVGKSTVAAGLGRALSNAGVGVAPFKAQNMSNNSYVAGEGASGGEIGRAQYVQALACRVAPSVHHNPVLLKPIADDSSQVVVRGQVVGQTRAREYFASNAPLRELAFESLALLRARHECVVLEGAGSCAEVNLRDREYVNFPAAHAAKARAILVADIDKGGVFAQVIGSLELMRPEDRARVGGIVINKFRGDRRLFDDGVAFIEQRTGLPVLGVLPFDYGLDLDAEDAMPLAAAIDPEPGRDAERITLAVVRLPHISNFTDFDSLCRLPGVAVHFISRPRDLSSYAAVILPGSKSTRGDLAWLREVGLDRCVLDYHQRGGKLLGICAGYQMLTRGIADPDGLEGAPGRSAGFGLVRGEVELRAPKVVRRVSGTLPSSGRPISGYEIHLGRVLLGEHQCLLSLTGPGVEQEGVRDDAGRVWGTSLHGLFDEAGFRDAFLSWLEPSWPGSEEAPTRTQWIDGELDRFAALLQRELDWPRILAWARGGGRKAAV